MTITIANRTLLHARREPSQRCPARTVAIAIATPVLALVLSWGLVDACAFTQHSLMGVYAAGAAQA